MGPTWVTTGRVDCMRFQNEIRDLLGGPQITYGSKTKPGTPGNDRGLADRMQQFTNQTT
ncbi:13040_t:CDS:2 [Dentiscutata erythropus]|uniref:13040_t:CDS:1 n=1 Tax=Dentiscutata erythropus TaxID=1348616 RepID=A0A9N9GZ84_9GLOM|nr:13040_t:CDS:2 [Dentiscutata erythropus]